MRAGQALTQLVEFTDGSPDGDVVWELLNGRGQQVATGAVTPVPDSASTVIKVEADQNAIEADVLCSPRELNWSYTVGGLITRGSLSYQLEAFLPLGVSRAGVRHKLGLEPHELEDEAIDLPAAYGRFQSKVGAENLDAVEGVAATAARDGIEAMCALTLLPSLQVSLAAKQSSGTDQFQRTKIDWETLNGQLEAMVADGMLAVSPNLDETLNFGPLVVPVVRDDPVTNTTP